MSTESIDEKPAVQVERRWWLFTACLLVSLTNEVSTAVTNLSLGPMRRDLGASSAVMQMVVTLGKLMLGAFMLAGGVAGDVYGRRRVLVLGRHPRHGWRDRASHSGRADGWNAPGSARS